MEQIKVFLPALLSLTGVAVLVACLFMYVAAKLAMIRNATVLRSLAAAVVSSPATWLLTGFFAPVPLMGSCSGFVIGLALSLLIIARIFDTTTAKAFLVWVFFVLAQFVALFIAGVIFARDLLHYLSPPSTLF